MTDNFDLSVLDDIAGAPAGFDANTGEQLFYQLLPKEMVELNIEIGMHHPKLLKLLGDGLRDDAYSPDRFFGIIFAYCGIALDGTYPMLELCEQAARALINKREVLATSVNTIPTSQALVRHIIHVS